MYNVDFLDKINEFNRYLYGNGCVDSRDVADEASKMSFLPLKNLEIVPCHEAPNGEWVPDTYIEGGLEEKTTS